MRLMMISLTPMTVSIICLSAVFVHALHTPTRPGPAIGAWMTTVTAANDWSEERLFPAILHDTHGKKPPN
jgi:hypothetical protein